MKRNWLWQSGGERDALLFLGMQELTERNDWELIERVRRTGSVRVLERPAVFEVAEAFDVYGRKPGRF